MVYTQAVKGSNKLADGRKRREYYICSIIISKSLFNALDWKKGDELEFKLERNKVVLRKKI